MIFLMNCLESNMNFDKQPVITPLIINGLVLWDYAERAFQYESFLMFGDHGWYSPVRFERL